MENREFQYLLKVLKWGGSDMVLGVDWSSQFNPILLDFCKGRIRFIHGCTELELSTEAMKEKFQMMTKGEKGLGRN